MDKRFSEFASFPENPDYENRIRRMDGLNRRDNDVRSEFMRDYTRILHCSAFRRLKHKTQVFFSPQSDHICTRIEHVLHVESIATSIAISLGLNQELVRAIAIGHDLGHSPFGHKGEKVLDEIYMRELGQTFRHEMNSLFVIDKIAMLEDSSMNKTHLNLTYAVRDGIISHCGEAKNTMLLPRKENCDLYSLGEPGTFMPYTFEGCAVRYADKISYIGRDIEDALSLGVIDEKSRKELNDLVGDYTQSDINNTVIIKHLVGDLCNNSTPEKGIGFSEKENEFLRLLEKFNVAKIYQTERVIRADKYFRLVINEIFDLFIGAFQGEKTFDNLKKLEKSYPVALRQFNEWLGFYAFDRNGKPSSGGAYFDVTEYKSYANAVLTYISGMTDRFAMDTYNQIISF